MESHIVHFARPFTSHDVSANMTAWQALGHGARRHTMSKICKEVCATDHERCSSVRYACLMQVDQAGIDLLLVGDSAAMVVHGHDNTLPITLDEMIVHCKAVARGASRPFLVGDMPFGSYEVSTTQAVTTAVRLLKEGGMDAVKLEGALSCELLFFSCQQRPRGVQASQPMHGASCLAASWSVIPLWKAPLVQDVAYSIGHPGTHSFLSTTAVRAALLC